MAHGRLAALIAALAVALGFVAPATAADPPAGDAALAPVVLTPDPVLLTYSGPPPHGCPGSPLICYLPLPIPTLHVVAKLRQPGSFGVGPAVAGETVVFSVGAKPTAADPTGGVVVCTATTDASGVAACDNGGPGVSLVLALLGLGGWVSHPASAGYGFTVARMPLVAQACGNPLFC
jgi:hypothetical protein